MKNAILALSLSALTCGTAALAQDSYQPPGADQGFPQDAPLDDGSDDLGSRLERGAQSLLQDLFRDVEPHMNAITRELSLRMDELSPVLDDLSGLMDDIGNYQAPERLENGDILIRRKADAPPPPVVSRRLQDLVAPAPENSPEKGPDEKPAPKSGDPGAGEIEL